ncbi:divalent metal cation transporter, partial [Escherichia coli]|uniref:divalent metal cation transporter n=1 Tax=Escherichia coli TaxID=562 RepID=UPI00207BE310
VMISLIDQDYDYEKIDDSNVMVMSQVLLSFGIALALVPLLIFTSDSKLMGDLVNSKRVKQTGWVIVVL